jgi:hypothetical protein
VVEVEFEEVDPSYRVAATEALGGLLDRMAAYLRPSAPPIFSV